jgi:succinate-acetate transporter protein
MAQVRAFALSVTKLSIGIFGVVLFMCTPTTDKGFLAFFSLLVVLIILAVVLTKHRRKESESRNIGGLILAA